MKKILTLVFLAFSIAGYAQNHSLDSLELLLQSIKVDSAKLVVLEKLSSGYAQGNTAKFKEFSTQGIALSAKLNDLNKSGYFNKKLGFYHRRINQHDSAIYYYKKAQELYLKAGDSSKYYYVEYDYGNLKRAIGKNEEALNHFLTGLDFYKGKKDSVALKNYLIGNLNVGTLYMRTGNYQLAIRNFKQILSHKVAQSDARLLTVTGVNIVGAYSALKKNDSALMFAERTKRIATSPYQLGHISNNMATIYVSKKEYGKALDQFKQSYGYFEQLENKGGMITSLNNIGDVYTKQANYEAAEKALLKANELLKTTNKSYSQQANYEFLKNLYRKTASYEKASNVQAKLAVLSDTINSKERLKSMADLEVKYETDRIAAEKETALAKAALAQAESDRNRLYFLGALVVGGLLVLASLFFYGRMRARKKAELITMELRETQKRLALEKQYRESELKALKSQMNPHFIFNALNSIQEYIVLNKKNEASDYLGKFADLIRTYLNHSDTGIISLQEEMESLDMYLDLESLRFEDKLHYQLKASDQLNMDLIHIPTMLIQPYVENSLKHGLLHKKNDRKLVVTFNPSENNTISCVIQDNGVGREKAKEFQANKNRLHKSFAAKATEERLDLLNYGKDKKIGVNIVDLYDEDSIATGTKVILQIPIKRG